MFGSRRGGGSGGEAVKDLAKSMAEDPKTAALVLLQDIGSCELWLDADDEDTLTATPEVSDWADKSGNGNDVSQGTLANRPETGSVVNGRNALNFDGSNHYMNAAGALFTTAPFTAFGVVVPDHDSSAKVALWVGDKDSPSEAWHMVRLTRGGLCGMLMPDSGTGQISAYTKRLYSIGETVLITAMDAGETDHRTWFNGGWRFSSTEANTPDNADLTVVGRSGDSTPGLYFDGRICELLVFTKALSDRERELVEAYLAEKWGATLVGVPPQVPGLEVWLDPDDDDFISVVGGVVQSIDNKVTNPDSGVTTLAPINTNNGAFPTATTINSLRAIRFTNDAGSIATQLVAEAAVVTAFPLTVFLVGQMDGSTGTGSTQVVFQASSAWISFGVSNDKEEVSFHSATAISVTAGTPFLTTGVQASSTSTALYKDGTGKQTDSTSQTNPSGAFGIGIQDSTTIPGDFRIGEVLIYTRDLTTAERKKVEDYLKGKWGL